MLRVSDFYLRYYIYIYNYNINQNLVEILVKVGNTSLPRGLEGDIPLIGS